MQLEPLTLVLLIMDDLWASLQDLAGAETATILEVGELIDLFIDMVSDSWQWLSAHDRNECAQILLSANAVKNNHQFAARRLLTMLATANRKPADYASFLATIIRADPVAVDMLPTTGFEHVVSIIWFYRYTEETLVESYMNLLSTVLARHDVSWENLDVIDHNFVYFTFQKADEFSYEHGPGLACYRVIASLNHQYLNYPVRENLVLKVLGEDLHKFRSIGSGVIWHLNRPSSVATQILNCKLLYGILGSCDLFYLNDLRVLIDILVRELLDMNDDLKTLRELYLMTLWKVIDNSAFESEPYKRSAIVQVLRVCLNDTDDENVVNLVHECLSVRWLGWSADVHVSPHSSHDNLVLASTIPHTDSVESVYLRVKRDPDETTPTGSPVFDECSPFDSPENITSSPLGPSRTPTRPPEYSPRMPARPPPPPTRRMPQLQLDSRAGSPSLTPGREVPTPPPRRKAVPPRPSPRSRPAPPSPRLARPSTR